MERKKDKVVVAVIGGITSNQVGNLMKEIIKIKQKYTPNGRGTIGIGNREDVGALIQGKRQRRINKKNT